MPKYKIIRTAVEINDLLRYLNDCDAEDEFADGAHAALSWLFDEAAPDLQEVN